LGENKAVPILVKALHDPIPAVRGAAVMSLGKLHARDSANEITRMLADKNPGVRADAVAVLLEFQSPYGAVADTVREVMRDKEPSIRSRIARALSRGQGASLHDAVEGLKELLHDTLPLPRMSASRALGHMKLPQSVALLKEALHDQDEAVRATAAGALIRALDGKAGLSRHGEPS
jgi:HEAT repeat protein